MAAMWHLVWPAAAFVFVTLAALILRTVVLAPLRRWVRAPTSAAFLDAIRMPSVLWAIVLGLYVGIEVVDVVTAFRTRVVEHLRSVLTAAVILSVTMTTAGIVGTIIGRAGDRLGRAVTGLAQTCARGVVMIVGLLVLLSSLGLHITPILTALGVGGLAVALALQDTLSNLFAGVHLLADKPIRVGDYVKIGDAVEGVVLDVGWRSTRLRLLHNSIVVVPNRTVAQSTITNYDMPEPRMTLAMRVSVDSASDPDRVEAVLISEVQNAVGHVPGLLAEPQPTARLIPGFGESSLDFTLACPVASFTQQFEVQHHLRKRILKRLRAEGIEMPFPSRTVHVKTWPPAMPH